MESDVKINAVSVMSQTNGAEPRPESKTNEVISLFAEKMSLEIWCGAVYGFDPVFKPAQEMDWLSLPQELWLIIFSYLPQAELFYNVHRVCKYWSMLSRDISLWQSIDFHILHEDLGVCADHTPDNARVSKADFLSILNAFRDHIKSIKISRYFVDYPLKDCALEQLCMCTTLTKLNLGYCQDVRWHIVFKQCTSLKELILEGCKDLRDEDLKHIHYLKNLEILCVSHCVYLTDKFLTFLYKLSNFRNLVCDGVMHITEAGLIEFFHRQPLMEVLVLDGENMTDDLVCSAVLSLPRLVIFELSFSESLTGRSLYSFAGKFQIEGLKFRKASEITTSSMCKIFGPGKVFQLKSFEITECEYMDDNALIALSLSCLHLTSLTVDWCWEISDRGICEVVNNCRYLQRISLVGLFTLEGVGWLNNLEKKLPYLKFLDASDCNRFPDEELIRLVRRKRTIEVYTYYHEKISLETTVADNQPCNNNIWICPGETGAQVIF